MNEAMVERVARALASRKYSHCGGPDGSLTSDGRKNWMWCVHDARAAIEAMTNGSPPHPIKDTAGASEDGD